MGKPSCSNLSNKSKHSLKPASMNNSLHSLKQQKLQLKKLEEKTRAQVDRLIEEIKNDSVYSVDSSHNDTVINNNVSHRKHRLSNTSSRKSLKRKKTDSLIILKDDDDIIFHNNNGIHPQNCSTPKANQSKTSINISQNSNNLTKVINPSSYLTIDLTNDTKNVSKNPSENDESKDCIVLNSSDDSSSNSDVTVIRNTRSKRRTNRRIRTFVDGISKLNPSEKGRLLELITQKIFNGCNVPDSVKQNIESQRLQSKATETAEDTYIKEVILGQTKSRNSIGSNIYNPEKNTKKRTGLRMIVIDGSNVAMEHGKGKVFSVRGLQICINYFLKRGHTVKAFVPRFRCKFGKSTEPRLLDSLERQGLVVYTPSREVQGKMITSYDDRYIIQCAAEFDGVIVTGDNYRDLVGENPRWRSIIETRLLPFTWVGDMIMFPRDPLGRYGPSLEAFLKHP